MGLPTEQPDRRSPHVHARTPCSATLAATRPQASRDAPVAKKERPKFRPAPDDFSEFTNRSAVIRSSRPDADASGRAATADLWSPVLYDPSSDSVRIMPPSRPTPLGSQFREFKDRINEKTHKLAGLLSPDRSESLPLPLRVHETPAHNPAASASKTQLSAQCSSSRLGRADWKAFDLMAPPPGRRRSGRTTQDDSFIPKPEESEDANPSEALTSQIASSILQERRRVRGTEASPPNVQQNEHLQRNLPNHRGQKSESSIRSSRAIPLRAASKSRSLPPGRRPSEDDDDPFTYDRLTRNDFAKRGRGGATPEIGSGKGAVYHNRTEYPCPYRRRNPVLFNVRDHEHCAKQPFSDMSELKQHIRTYHRRRKAFHHCPRCKQSFGSENALGEHLTVPVEEMCEPRPATSECMVEDGITEATERALVDETIKIQSWKELWWLLFPQDPAVLDPEIIPVLEAIEAEQEFDNSAAELKADLCESLTRILPEQVGDGPLFQVLAGQIQLVLEQHRAKVLRRCRAEVCNGDKRASMERKPIKTSRFSTAATTYGSHGGGRRPSLFSEKSRRSQWQSVASKSGISPSSSSVYSQGSGSHYSLGSSYQSATRTNSLSSAGALHVESPRLPFRDWVHGVKYTNEVVSPGQRDSGLAMQCEECNSEPCQCVSYADQLSAFLTPAVVAGSVLLPPHGAVSCAVEEDDSDWEAQYGGKALSAGRVMVGPGLQDNFGTHNVGRDGQGQGLLSARTPFVHRPQGAFI